jgi:FecR protein
MNKTLGRSALASAALLFIVAVATASGALADEGDPPTRIARLAFVEGPVSVEPGGTQDWIEAPLNRPLTTGDALWSDVNGRVELELDGSLLRLSSRTAVSFLNLGDQITQIQLTCGTLIVRVRQLGDDETYEIDTPNLAFSVLRPGLYRISVAESGSVTTIGVGSGQGEVTGSGSAFAVGANEQITFSGTDVLNEVAQVYTQGAFDAWSASRDDRWDNSVSSNYVSPDVVGLADLDTQGSWVSTPGFGYVWFPRGLGPRWAPYHVGYWAYIPPWGYTWVDNQPWGFAPFHYGRWISVGGSWGWVPAPPRPRGATYVRPVYAPALVAWVGVGAGVAWFALGPREVYVPSYPVSRIYLNNINVSNTVVNGTVVNIRYINRAVPGAVTATTAQAFTSAQPVATHAIPFDTRSSAPVQALPPAVVPTRQAILGGGRAGTARPPAAVQARVVVARTAPPPSVPTFERRQQAIAQNGGRPLSIAAVRQIQTQAAPRAVQVRIAPPATLGLHRPVGQPVARPAIPAIRASRPPALGVHPNDSPSPPRPVSPSVANSALERQHRQEQQQDDAHRQQLQQQLEQQHQRQTQALQEKHTQEQEQLQGQQQQQRQQQESQTKPAVSNEEKSNKPEKPLNQTH